MSKCKGPELGVGSVYSWRRNEGTVAGVREAWGEGVRGAEADQTSEWEIWISSQKPWEHAEGYEFERVVQWFWLWRSSGCPEQNGEQQQQVLDLPWISNPPKVEVQGRGEQSRCQRGDPSSDLCSSILWDEAGLNLVCLLYNCVKAKLWTTPSTCLANLCINSKPCMGKANTTLATWSRLTSLVTNHVDLM